MVLIAATPFNKRLSDLFSATTELTTTIGALVMEAINTVQCGTNMYRSELLNLQQLIRVTGTF